MYNRYMQNADGQFQRHTVEEPHRQNPDSVQHNTVRGNRGERLPSQYAQPPRSSSYPTELTREHEERREEWSRDRHPQNGPQEESGRQGQPQERRQNREQHREQQHNQGMIREPQRNQGHSGQHSQGPFREEQHSQGPFREERHSQGPFREERHSQGPFREERHSQGPFREERHSQGHPGERDSERGYHQGSRQEGSAAGAGGKETSRKGRHQSIRRLDRPRIKKHPYPVEDKERDRIWEQVHKSECQSGSACHNEGACEATGDNCRDEAHAIPMQLCGEESRPWGGHEGKRKIRIPFLDKLLPDFDTGDLLLLLILLLLLTDGNEDSTSVMLTLAIFLFMQ